MKILVTGAAGFIGFNLVERLIGDGLTVYGLDNINDYYDVELKYNRLAQSGIDKSKIAYNIKIPSSKYENYSFIKLNLEDKDSLFDIFTAERFDMVCNLAAQAGVRYSLTNPYAYIESNIVGFINILEACRSIQVKHLVYASSSSVYGLNEALPFSVHNNVDHPISLYAASKKSNELMAHTYSHLFQIPTTGLRFFTVYGPWGRPDMALFMFTKAILEDKPIDVYNYGNMLRDFTYIDDIIEGVVRVLNSPAKPNLAWDAKNPDTSSSPSPYRIYNIGNNSPVNLLDFITEIENALGKTAIKRLMPMQPGDVATTWADVTDLQKELGFTPSTNVKTGVSNFIKWYKQYYNC